MCGHHRPHCTKTETVDGISRGEGAELASRCPLGQKQGKGGKQVVGAAGGHQRGEGEAMEAAENQQFQGKREGERGAEEAGQRGRVEVRAHVSGLAR